MWAEACALLDEAERKHRHFFELLTAPEVSPAWEPPADIFADDSELQVVVALPGARAEDVVVQLTLSGLQIDTHVPPPAPRAPLSRPAGPQPAGSILAGSRLNIVRLEIPYGRMQRRIDLPSGRYALIERRLERGCLFLRLTRETP